MTGAPLPWAANPFLSAEFLLTVALLVTVLLVGAVVLFVLDRWRKRQVADNPPQSVESLTSFRTMYERGEITEAEYQAVRERMAGRMKREVAAANPAAAIPPPGPGASGGEGNPAGGAASPPDDAPSG